MSNVLVIAPLQSNLAKLPSEAQEAVNLLSRAGYRVRLVQSPVTILELHRTLDDAPYELCLFGGHGSAEGFVLDQEILKPADLGRLLSDARCKGAVLNSCFSVEHVEVIQSQADIDIIATIRPQGVSDQEAWGAMLFLVRAFVGVKSLHGAYRQVFRSSSATQYRWFPSIQSQRGWGMDDRENELERIEHSVTRLGNTVDTLVRTLQGDDFSRRPGLIDELGALRQEIQQYISADAQWKRTTEQRIEILEREQRGRKVVLTQSRAVVAVILFAGCLVTAIFITWLLATGGR